MNRSLKAATAHSFVLNMMKIYFFLTIERHRIRRRPISSFKMKCSISFDPSAIRFEFYNHLMSQEVRPLNLMSYFFFFYFLNRHKKCNEEIEICHFIKCTVLLSVIYPSLKSTSLFIFSIITHRPLQLCILFALFLAHVGYVHRRLSD